MKFILNSLIPNEILEVTSEMHKDSLQMTWFKAFDE